MKQKCYFHKNRFIQNFCCLKQCTLPLCPQCLPIHEQQHNSRQQISQIITYQQAYHQAYQNLYSYVQRNKQIKNKIFESFKNDKKQCMKIIQKHFIEMQNQLKQNFKQYDQIQQKYQKFLNGSIKTLIYYYSGQLQLKQIAINQYKPIFNDIKYTLQNFNKKKNQIQTFRQNYQKQTQKSQYQSINFDKVKLDSGLKRQKSRKKSIFNNQITHNHKHTNQPYTQNLNNEQKRKTYNVSENKKQESFYIENQKNYQKKITQKSSVYEISLENPSFRIPSKKQEQQSNTFNAQNFINKNHKQSYRSITNNIQLAPSYSQLILNKRQSIPSFSQQNKSTFRLESEVKEKNWNKRTQQNQQNMLYGRRNASNYSNLDLRENSNILNRAESINRKPLQTTDLETYSPIQIRDDSSKYQMRNRAVSHELGHKTMSYNHLPSNRKNQPFDQNLKKQVLSPHEIRKMLQKRIEQRNKVLTDKKQSNLKIDNNQNYKIQKSNFSKLVGKQIFKVNENTYQNNDLKNGYNTRQSIINQIYRETRY